jgi:hypothetical protein
VKETDLLAGALEALRRLKEPASFFIREAGKSPSYREK